MYRLKSCIYVGIRFYRQTINLLFTLCTLLTQQSEILSLLAYFCHKPKKLKYAKNQNWQNLQSEDTHVPIAVIMGPHKSC